jgi:hypothetical protein
VALSLLTILDRRPEKTESMRFEQELRICKENRRKIGSEFRAKKGGTNGYLFVPGGQ